MHLGERRVSVELLGFDLPVRDGAAQKEFYTDLGFEAEEANGNVRLTSPGAPDVHIELHPARPGSQPQFLFPVPDARKAAGELKDAGVKADRDNKLLFVHDPDGNIFVFLETGEPKSK
jgi:catechol 2,3-dioxygenase-like lactoylglutathione lyase family enzyme